MSKDSPKKPSPSIEEVLESMPFSSRSSSAPSAQTVQQFLTQLADAYREEKEAKHTEEKNILTKITKPHCGVKQVEGEEKFFIAPPFASSSPSKRENGKKKKKDRSITTVPREMKGEDVPLKTLAAWFNNFSPITLFPREEIASIAKHYHLPERTTLRALAIHKVSPDEQLFLTRMESLFKGWDEYFSFTTPEEVDALKEKLENSPLPDIRLLMECYIRKYSLLGSKDENYEEKSIALCQLDKLIKKEQNRFYTRSPKEKSQQFMNGPHWEQCLGSYALKYEELQELHDRQCAEKTQGIRSTYASQPDIASKVFINSGVASPLAAIGDILTSLKNPLLQHPFIPLQQLEKIQEHVTTFWQNFSSFPNLKGQTDCLKLLLGYCHKLTIYSAARACPQQHKDILDAICKSVDENIAIWVRNHASKDIPFVYHRLTASAGIDRCSSLSSKTFLNPNMERYYAMRGREKLSLAIAINLPLEEKGHIENFHRLHLQSLHHNNKILPLLFIASTTGNITDHSLMDRYLWLTHKIENYMAENNNILSYLEATIASMGKDENYRANLKKHHDNNLAPLTTLYCHRALLNMEMIERGYNNAHETVYDDMENVEECRKTPFLSTKFRFPQSHVYPQTQEHFLAWKKSYPKHVPSVVKQRKKEEKQPASPPKEPEHKGALPLLPTLPPVVKKQPEENKSAPVTPAPEIKSGQPQPQKKERVRPLSSPPTEVPPPLPSPATAITHDAPPATSSDENKTPVPGTSQNKKVTPNRKPSKRQQRYMREKQEREESKQRIAEARERRKEMELLKQQEEAQKEQEKHEQEAQGPGEEAEAPPSPLPIQPIALEPQAIAASPDSPPRPEVTTPTEEKGSPISARQRKKLSPLSATAKPFIPPATSQPIPVTDNTPGMPLDLLEMELAVLNTKLQHTMNLFAQKLALYEELHPNPKAFFPGSILFPSFLLANNYLMQGYSPVLPPTSHQTPPASWQDRVVQPAPSGKGPEIP